MTERVMESVFFSLINDENILLHVDTSFRTEALCFICSFTLYTKFLITTFDFTHYLKSRRNIIQTRNI